MQCTIYSPCEYSAGRKESDSTDRSLVQASEHYPASAKSRRALLARTLFMWRAKRLDATTRTCVSQTDWYCHLALLFGVFQSFNQYVSNEVPFCQTAHQLSAGEYVNRHNFVNFGGFVKSKSMWSSVELSMGDCPSSPKLIPQDYFIPTFHLIELYLILSHVAGEICHEDPIWWPSNGNH